MLRREPKQPRLPACVLDTAGLSTDRVIVAGHINNLEAAASQLGLSARDPGDLVLAAYTADKNEFLNILEGDFAVLIANRDASELCIGLSRGSSHRAFYAEDNRSVACAMDLSSIQEVVAPPRRIENDALVMLATWGFVIPPMTHLKGVKQLLPGEAIQWSLSPHGMLQRDALSIAQTIALPGDNHGGDSPASLESSLSGNKLSELQIGSYDYLGELRSFNLLARLLSETFEPIFSKTPVLMYLAQEASENKDQDFIQNLLGSLCAAYKYPDFSSASIQWTSEMFNRRYRHHVDLSGRQLRIDQELRSAYAKSSDTAPGSRENFMQWFAQNCWLFYLRCNYRAVLNMTIGREAADQIALPNGIPEFSMVAPVAVDKAPIFSKDAISIFNIYDAYRRLFFHSRSGICGKLFDLSTGRYLALLRQSGEAEISRSQDLILGALSLAWLERESNLVND